MTWMRRMGVVTAALWGVAALAANPPASSEQAVNAQETEVVRTPGESHPFRGISVLLGGGLEGYTGSLAPRVSPGPTYGVGVALRPSDILGFEFDYSGAVHEIDTSRTAGTDVASGADVVRNGGRALVTIGLTDTQVQPYILGGVGINRYDVRGRADLFGYRNDTSGEIPLGAGIHGQFGNVTVDLRGDYVVPFSQQFAPSVGTTSVGSVQTSNAGQYQGTLRLGARF